MGEITIEFTPANDLGVLDHVVNLPSGELVFIRCGWCRPATSGARWCSRCGAGPRCRTRSTRPDAAAVAADLATLKRVLER